MANYLMPADGGQATAIGTARSRDDIISVDNMYRVKIYNKSGTIQFTGFIPPDFAFSLSSQWDAPFANTSVADVIGAGGNAVANTFGGKLGAAGSFVGNNAGAMDKALKFAGASSMHKLASARVWGGPSYLTVELPIFVDAYSDTKTEVVDTTINLLSLCAPSENGGLLLPPGPSPLKSVSMETMTIAASGASADAANAAMNGILEDSEAFFVDIGNFFSMSPCVVDSVNANFDNVWEDGTGNPISVDFILQVSSYFAVTREDLRKWLKHSQ
ncbi:PmgG-like head morphogenesis [Erwinia phage vB_EamM_Alexandra]|uniref:Uncharacterized protein n=1 Tax=Erwinia phage vB_EamM_Alexandra TaxID=2201424 RepID=A0A2Z4QEQ4_9CAUD|nr:PmgG-like head morphogenesis [Erwinia phage vB_EamM_Alexandra]AWY08404.1 hypothetical protein Alexandra_132 [Erwinia phage vB_EamM_Alexandra]